MKKKKKLSKVKRLIRIRHGLMLLAALLFLLTIFSGYMAFFSSSAAPEARHPATSETNPSVDSTTAVEFLDGTDPNTDETKSTTAEMVEGQAEDEDIPDNGKPSGAKTDDGKIDGGKSDDDKSDDDKSDDNKSDDNKSDDDKSDDNKSDDDKSDDNKSDDNKSDDNKSDDDKSDDDKSDDDKSDDDKSDDDKSDDNKSDDNKSDDNKSDDNKSDDNKSDDDKSDDDKSDDDKSDDDKSDDNKSNGDAKISVAKLSFLTATLPSEPFPNSPIIFEDQPEDDYFWKIVFFSCLALLALDLLAVLLLDRKILSMRKKNPQSDFDSLPHTQINGDNGVYVTQPMEPMPTTPSLTIGTLHQPGRRQYQQDSLGHGLVLGGRGILAVLADGMGGLQDGDKVSQKIIVRSLELGATLQSNQVGGALYRILNQVNEDVNRMLTPSGLYKCGSTMVAVLVQDMTFQWISVGDSRIYLYREGYVNRLNRDHDLFQDWMPDVLNGTRLMEDCMADTDGRKLTSFIGMGRLKYVDGSISAIDILPGDRILLMSDGVYGEVPEEDMAAILQQYPDVNQAAAALDHRIRANQNPHQDNYTALILGF